MNRIERIKEWWNNRNGLQYDGTQYEEYKKRRNKWLRLSFLGVIIPFLLPLIISFFEESLSFTEMIGSGEVLLSLYALVISLAFDLWESKEKEQKDEELDKSFWLCIAIIVFLIAAYVSIRLTTPSITEILQESDASREKELIEKRDSLFFRNIICMLLLSLSAIFCCNRAIIALYNHTDNLTREAQ